MNIRRMTTSTTLVSEHDEAGDSVLDLVIDGQPLTIEHVHDVGTSQRRLKLSDDPAIRERMQAAVSLVERAVTENWRVYGVTTCFGGMAEFEVPGETAAASQNNLLSFLAAGAGRPIDRRHVRAAMALRANVLMRGISGVRVEIVDRLVRFLAADATPVVRDLGSIGASGDLIPLACIARAITGHKNCRVQIEDREVDGTTALGELDLEPLELHPKEALAIVNGTSFSAAIAANCVYETKKLLGLTLASHAMMLQALCVQDDPFHPFVHQYKPHAGQVWTANMMRRLLHEGVDGTNGRRDHVQDRYSLRCLPQYLGPIVDGIARVSKAIHTEMNSVSDNPLVGADDERFYQGGNFLGQYIGMGMDDLRRYLGLMAKHVDVQIAQLVAPEFSRGLPASLRGNGALPYNAGLKGLQITGNSIMPLLTYYGNPLVEHFPTHAEQFNQNVNALSWGSANLAWQSVELFQQYSALALIFAVQSLDLRAKSTYGHFDGSALLGNLLVPVYAAVHESAGVVADPEKPLIFDDADQSLENFVASLFADVSGRGPVSESIEPILASFDEDELGGQ